jgi:SAM-dependent methyltransferase
MRHFGRTYWRRRRNRLLRKQVRLEGKVLDIGSGWRVYSENALRLDINPDVKPDIVADIQKKTSFPDGHFDTVLMFDVLEHLENPFQALEEVKRVIRRGGTLYLTVPFCFPKHGTEYYRFSDLALRKLLEGFEVEIIPVQKSKFWNLIWNYYWQDRLVEGYFLRATKQKRPD